MRKPGLAKRLQKAGFSRRTRVESQEVKAEGQESCELELETGRQMVGDSTAQAENLALLMQRESKPRVAEETLVCLKGHLSSDSL